MKEQEQNLKNLTGEDVSKMSEELVRQMIEKDNEELIGKFKEMERKAKLRREYGKYWRTNRHP